MVVVTRTDASERDLSDAELAGFASRLRGRLGVRPKAPSDRPPWNALHEDGPAVAVRCSGTADVVAAVNLARDHDLLTAVRGGGHSVAGLSTVAGGLLIDLAGMRGVHVDPGRCVARVQGGALLGDVDRETQVFGLATPLGRVSETGVAGLTLGGGYGNLAGAYGLSCDNLVEAQVVGADGVVRTASAESEPDLFWAIRGGGGNFGVVTSFTFRLHEVGPLVAFAATFHPLEEMVDVERRWRDLAVELPDAVSSFVVTMTFPAVPGVPDAVHDRPVVIVAAMHSGPAEEGMRVLQPLRELGTVLFDMSGPTPYCAVQSAFDPFFPRQGLRAYWRSHYLDELTDEAIATIGTVAADRPSPLTLVNTYHLGGAVHRVGAEDTAFAERSSPFMVSVDTMWSDPAQDSAATAWAAASGGEIAAHANGRVFLNFTGRTTTAPSVDDAFGRNLVRLGQVKARYDPTNLFRLNNNVLPRP
jgi:FAD/FMN-containing dehydrogenase